MIKRIPPLTWFATLVALAIILVLVIPPRAVTLQMYHISPFVYREIILALFIPYFLIWFAAFFAFAKLQQYRKALGEAAEGKGFAQISTGIGVLAMGVAISTIASLAVGSATSGVLEVIHTIVSDYMQLAFALVGFTYIGNGIHKLAVIADIRPTLRAMRALFSIVAVIGVFFTFFALHTRYAHGNPYHLPPFLLLATVIVPYIYTWFAGLMGVYELARYAYVVKGVIYKRALNTLAVGLTTVIVSSIIIQYVTSSIGGASNIGLSTIVIIIYLLLAMLVAGYVLIALSANQLKKIEEV